jgi:pyrimidine-specific ribonucleoside hydrolase
MDPAGTIAAVTTAHRPWLVISDVTFRPEIDVTAEHWLYRQLRQHLEPWAQLAADHMDRWFERFVPGTMQHDPLTLSIALGIPFVQFDYTPIALAGDARMRHHPDGTMVFLAREAHYGPFMQWIGKQLGLEASGT